MKPINELYNFEKFWDLLARQNRAVSSWDVCRTDKEVFVKRTVAKWISGKFYQVEIERHVSVLNLLPEIQKQHSHYKIFTKYVYITNITFVYVRGLQLRINYIEPHSEKIEEVLFGYNDFIKLKLVENEAEFLILKKFYPITTKPYF